MINWKKVAQGRDRTWLREVRMSRNRRSRLREKEQTGKKSGERERRREKGWKRVMKQGRRKKERGTKETEEGAVNLSH